MITASALITSAVTAALLMLPAELVGCYAPGDTAAARGAWSVAADAYADARHRVDCGAARPGLTFALARALRRQALLSGDPRWECRALQAYAELGSGAARIDASDDDEDRLALMHAQCAAPSGGARAAPAHASVGAVASPPLAPVGGATGWWFAGSAVTSAITGGVLYGLALDAAEQRDAAVRRFAAGVGDADGARGDVERHHDRARALLGGSYASWAAAGLLTGVAVWLWLDDADTPTASAPGTVAWTFADP